MDSDLSRMPNMEDLDQILRASQLIRGNLLGIQRRIRSSKDPADLKLEAILKTVEQLMSPASKIEGFLLRAADAAEKAGLSIRKNPEKKERTPRLRSSPRETAAGLSSKEAGRRLGLSVPTVLELLHTGRLRGRKTGKIWRILPESVDAYLMSSTRSRMGNRSLADELNRKSKTHDWEDRGNAAVCKKCGLSAAASIEWRVQLGIADMNPCVPGLRVSGQTIR